jgi:hypothetical protein
VDATSVYWADLYDIAKVPLGGGAVTTLATSTTPNGGPIAVDATSVYFSNAYTGITSVPLGGGAARTRADGGAFIGVVGGSIYMWANFPGGCEPAPPCVNPMGYIDMVSLADGGAFYQIPSGSGYIDVATLDATNVYWVDNSQHALRSLAVGYGVTAAVASGLPPVSNLAADSTAVYLVTGGSVLLKVPLGGGPPATLTSNASILYGIVADGSSIYWTDAAAGTVMKMPRDGGLLTTLASAQDNPRAIAVDDTSVYWTNFGQPMQKNGAVMKRTPK